jgi:hypothetical protein
VAKGSDGMLIFFAHDRNQAKAIVLDPAWMVA